LRLVTTPSSSTLNTIPGKGKKNKKQNPKETKENAANRVTLFGFIMATCFFFSETKYTSSSKPFSGEGFEFYFKKFENNFV
jgi:hypothetical protein